MMENIQSKWINLSLLEKFEAKSDRVIKRAILAKAKIADGHISNGLQVYADANSLKLIADYINSTDEEISISTDHSNEALSVLGRVVPFSAKVIGNVVVADLEIFPGPSGDQFLGVAGESNEALTISLELPQAYEETETGLALRPTYVDCASIVRDGALTDELVLLSTKHKYQNKEIIMPAEIKKEVPADPGTPETLADAAPAVAPVAETPADEAKEAASIQSLSDKIDSILSILSGFGEEMKKLSAPAPVVPDEVAPVEAEKLSKKKEAKLVLLSDPGENEKVETFSIDRCKDLAYYKAHRAEYLAAKKIKV